MEWTTVPRAGQQGLRLSRAGKKSPQNIFDGTGNPLAAIHTQQLPRFGIGKDNLARTFKEDQDWETVENRALRVGICVSVHVQIHGLPRNSQHRSWRAFPHPSGSGLWSN